MTETEPPRRRWRFDHRGAFLLALLAPPLLAGAVGWFFYAASPNQTIGMIGIVIGLSPLVGGPSYLLVGAPLFWRAARRGARSPGRFAAVGLLADVIAAPIAALLLATLAFLVEGDEPGPSAAALAALAIHAVGLIFAPLYGAIFGAAYRRLAPPPEWESGLEAERTAAVFR